MLDDRNDYTHAGKGAKRRRLRLEDVPREIGRRRNKLKPYPDRPKSAKQEITKEEGNVTAEDLKAKIRKLTLQTHSFSEVCDELRRADYPGSHVLVSAVRSEMREIVKLLVEEGLMTEERLDLYRQHHQRARSRSRRSREAV